MFLLLCSWWPFGYIPKLVCDSVCVCVCGGGGGGGGGGGSHFDQGSFWLKVDKSLFSIS